jgi:flagellar hook-basal body complex protein FliE
MNELDPIAAIGASAVSGATAPDISAPTAPPNAAASATQVDFSRILSDATQALEARVEHADAMVRRFVVDDTTPLHEVTIAIEEARIAVELALQVRTRVVETYRDIANMQL